MTGNKGILAKPSSVQYNHNHNNNNNNNGSGSGVGNSNNNNVHHGSLMAAGLAPGEIWISTQAGYNSPSQARTAGNSHNANASMSMSANSSPLREPAVPEPTTKGDKESHRKWSFGGFFRRHKNSSTGNIKTTSPDLNKARPSTRSPVLVLSDSLNRRRNVMTGGSQRKGNRISESDLSGEEDGTGQSVILKNGFFSKRKNKGKESWKKKGTGDEGEKGKKKGGGGNGVLLKVPSGRTRVSHSNSPEPGFNTGWEKTKKQPGNQIPPPLVAQHAGYNSSSGSLEGGGSSSRSSRAAVKARAVARRESYMRESSSSNEDPEEDTRGSHSSLNSGKLKKKTGNGPHVYVKQYTCSPKPSPIRKPMNHAQAQIMNENAGNYGRGVQGSFSPKWEARVVYQEERIGENDEPVIVKSPHKNANVLHPSLAQGAYIQSSDQQGVISAGLRVPVFPSHLGNSHMAKYGFPSHMEYYYSNGCNVRPILYENYPMNGRSATPIINYGSVSPSPPLPPKRSIRNAPHKSYHQNALPGYFVESSFRRPVSCSNLDTCNNYPHQPKVYYDYRVIQEGYPRYGIQYPSEYEYQPQRLEEYDGVRRAANGSYVDQPIEAMNGAVTKAQLKLASNKEKMLGLKPYLIRSPSEPPEIKSQGPKKNGSLHQMGNSDPPSLSKCNINGVSHKLPPTHGHPGLSSASEFWRKKDQEVVNSSPPPKKNFVKVRSADSSPLLVPKFRKPTGAAISGSPNLLSNSQNSNESVSSLSSFSADSPNQLKCSPPNGTSTGLLRPKTLSLINHRTGLVTRDRSGSRSSRDDVKKVGESTDVQGSRSSSSQLHAYDSNNNNDDEDKGVIKSKLNDNKAKGSLRNPNVLCNGAYNGAGEASACERLKVNAYTNGCDKEKSNKSSSPSMTATSDKEKEERGDELQKMKTPNIKDTEKERSPKPEKSPGRKLEDALNELEDMYRSLKLSDEDLLDRAERRDLPIPHQELKHAPMRNGSLGSMESLYSSNHSFYSSESLSQVSGSNLGRPRQRAPPLRRSFIPDKVADDMANRTIKTYGKSVDPRAIVAKSGCYMSFSPAFSPPVSPCPSAAYDGYQAYPMPRQYHDPDVALDDMSYVHFRRANSMRIIEPQPPFGIPLEPSAPAPPTDYLHCKPSDRIRQIYSSSKIPDLVNDDIAYRSLRKDLSPDSVAMPNKDWTPRLFSPTKELNSELSKDQKRLRAIRSLSANVSHLDGEPFCTEFLRHNRWCSYNDIKPWIKGSFYHKYSKPSWLDQVEKINCSDDNDIEFERKTPKKTVKLEPPIYDPSKRPRPWTDILLKSFEEKERKEEEEKTRQPSIEEVGDKREQSDSDCLISCQRAGTPTPELKSQQLLDMQAPNRRGSWAESRSISENKPGNSLTAALLNEEGRRKSWSDLPHPSAQVAAGSQSSEKDLKGGTNLQSRLISHPVKQFRKIRKINLDRFKSGSERAVDQKSEQELNYLMDALLQETGACGPNEDDDIFVTKQFPSTTKVVKTTDVNEDDMDSSNVENKFGGCNLLGGGEEEAPSIEDVIHAINDSLPGELMKNNEVKDGGTPVNENTTLSSRSEAELKQELDSEFQRILEENELGGKEESSSCKTKAEQGSAQLGSSSSPRNLDTRYHLRDAMSLFRESHRDDVGPSEDDEGNQAKSSLSKRENSPWMTNQKPMRVSRTAHSDYSRTYLKSPLTSIQTSTGGTDSSDTTAPSDEIHVGRKEKDKAHKRKSFLNRSFTEEIVPEKPKDFENHMGKTAVKKPPPSSPGQLKRIFHLGERRRNSLSSLTTSNSSSKSSLNSYPVQSPSKLKKKDSLSEAEGVSFIKKLLHKETSNNGHQNVASESPKDKGFLLSKCHSTASHSTTSYWSKLSGSQPAFLKRLFDNGKEKAGSKGNNPDLINGCVSESERLDNEVKRGQNVAQKASFFMKLENEQRYSKWRKQSPTKSDVKQDRGQQRYKSGRHLTQPITPTEVELASNFYKFTDKNSTVECSASPRPSSTNGRSAFVSSCAASSAFMSSKRDTSDDGLDNKPPRQSVEVEPSKLSLKDRVDIFNNIDKTKMTVRSMFQNDCNEAQGEAGQQESFKKLKMMSERYLCNNITGNNGRHFFRRGSTSDVPDYRATSYRHSPVATRNGKLRYNYQENETFSEDGEFSSGGQEVADIICRSYENSPVFRRKASNLIPTSHNVGSQNGWQPWQGFHNAKMYGAVSYQVQPQPRHATTPDTSNLYPVLKALSSSNASCQQPVASASVPNNNTPDINSSSPIQDEVFAVSVPHPDDEPFQSFFRTADDSCFEEGLINPALEKDSQAHDDIPESNTIPHIERQRDPSAMKKNTPQLKRKSSTNSAKCSRNPLKALAARMDLRNQKYFQARSFNGDHNS